jgi:hypothetical protein
MQAMKTSPPLGAAAKPAETPVPVNCTRVQAALVGALALT